MKIHSALILVFMALSAKAFPQEQTIGKALNNNNDVSFAKHLLKNLDIIFFLLQVHNQVFRFCVFRLG